MQFCAIVGGKNGDENGLTGILKDQKLILQEIGMVISLQIEHMHIQLIF